MVGLYLAAVVARVQEFLLESPLPPFNKIDATGFWRQLTVRQAFNPAPTSAGDEDSSKGYGGGEASDAGSTTAALMLVFMVQHAAASNEAAEAEAQRLLKALHDPPLTPPMRLSVRAFRGNRRRACEHAEALPPLLALLLPPTVRTGRGVRAQVAVQGAEGPGEATPGAAEHWLHGPPYLEERLLGLSYRISTSAFFQVGPEDGSSVLTAHALRD